ncbi:MAG TPA: ATP-binding protein [Nitrospirota bacterium]
MRKIIHQSSVYIAVFLLIISIIIYLNIIFQENLKKDITGQFNRQQLLLARGAGLSIERQMDHYVKHLVTLSQIPSINQLKSSFLDEQFFSALLDDVPETDSMVVNFQLIDKNGILRFDRAMAGHIGDDMADRSYFKKTKHLLKGEVNISEMTRMEEISPAKRYVLISTPLYVKDGRTENFNGIALFAISVDDIAGDYVSQVRMGERGYAWVMDSHGTLVYHPTNPEMIGRNILHAEPGCFKCHKSFDAEKKIVQGSSMEYGVYTAPMGEDKLISYSRAKVGSESWLVCVSTPYSEVIGLIAKSMKLYSWLISIIFFSVIGASIYFIVLIKRKTAADEQAKYAAELEDRIRERTGELSREKEKLNAIVGGFGAGVSLLDLDCNVVWANDVITKNVPFAVGKSCYAAFMGRTSPCENCPMPEALNGGKIATTEMACKRVTPKDAVTDYISGDLLAMLSSDHVGYFQIVIAPVKDVEGNVTHVVELIQDISEIRNLEQHMMHSEKLAALGRISAGIAHEIGNPLTSISSYIQILQENRYDDFTDSSLETISSHIKRITGILQQITGFSRNYQIEKGPVDVNEAVKSSLDLLGHEKGLKGHDLDVDYFADRLAVVADEKWLVSVFVNLIINAIDAMPDKGRLSVSTAREVDHGKAMAVVVVSDTGIGIPADDIGRIFDPFFTTKQTGKGTGLGLAVSYNVIKELGGSISVTSHPGEGAAFTVKLPLEA